LADREPVRLAFVPDDGWAVDVIDAIGSRATVVGDAVGAHVVGDAGAARVALASDVASLTIVAPAPDPIWARAADIAVPTLVIGRPDVPARPFALALDLVTHIAGARRIDDDPQRPPLWERPIEFAAVVLAFATSVERAAGR